MTVLNTAAAWVPYDERRDADRDDEAAARLIEWLLGQGGQEAPVLVANALGASDGYGPVTEFGRRYGITSPRDRRDYGVGPVLVFMPDAKTLEYATRLSRVSPMAVVEGALLSMRGWAAATGAVNVADPGAAAEELPEGVVEELRRLEFHKNNGWGDPLGKRAARQCLERVRQLGFADRGAVKSWLLAHGSANRFKVLDRVMDDLGFAE